MTPDHTNAWGGGNLIRAKMEALLPPPCSPPPSRPRAAPTGSSDAVAVQGKVAATNDARPDGGGPESPGGPEPSLQAAARPVATLKHEHDPQRKVPASHQKSFFFPNRFFSERVERVRRESHLSFIWSKRLDSVSALPPCEARSFESCSANFGRPQEEGACVVEEDMITDDAAVVTSGTKGRCLFGAYSSLVAEPALPPSSDVDRTERKLASQSCPRARRNPGP